MHIRRAYDDRVRLAVWRLSIDTFAYKVLSLALHDSPPKLLAIRTVVHVVSDHRTRHISLSILQCSRAQTQLLSLWRNRIPIFFNLLELLFFRRACQSGLRPLSLGQPGPSCELRNIL